MQGVGGAAVATSLESAADGAPAPRRWPIEEGPDTPKLCLAPGDGGAPLPASSEPAPRPSTPPGRGPAWAATLRWFPRSRSLNPRRRPSNASYQRIRQFGVTPPCWVSTSAAPAVLGPWKACATQWTQAKAAGMVAYNAMINVSQPA